MDMPVKVPSVDSLTNGAGGGSRGWVDAAGQFRVGPQSAGATPGPACYGRGGEDPTVTHPHVVLGRLGTTQPLGGENPARPQRARNARAPPPPEPAVGVGGKAGRLRKPPGRQKTG